MLKAHANAYRMYYREFSETQRGEFFWCQDIPSERAVWTRLLQLIVGQVGITLNINTALPFSNSPEDVEAAERENQFFLGWFGHPILKDGNYPQVMIDKVAFFL